MRKIMTFLACMAVAPVAAGCHGMAYEYCDQVCNCENCSDREYDECVVVYEAEVNKSSAFGCYPEHEDLHACSITDNVCVLNIFAPDPVACAGEIADLADCINDNSALR